MSAETINNVISMRNGLKAGMNWPLRVYADNAFVIVDESLPYTFTIWDDKNGTLYYFRLPDAMTDRDFKNYPEISVAAVNYDFIQTMEIAHFPIKSLDKLFTSIKAEGGTNLTSEMEEFIKHIFTRILSNKTPNLEKYITNAAHGNVLEDQDDDYYNGRMHTPFKETHTIGIVYNNLAFKDTESNP